MTSDFTLIAGLAGLTAIWTQVRGLLDRVRSSFIIRATLHGEIATLVSNHLYAHGRVINWGDRYIRSSSAWVRPLERVAEVAFEHPPLQPLLVWLNHRPLMFHCPREMRNGGASTPELNDLLVLTSLRGCLDVTALTRAALETARTRQSEGKRYFVRRVAGRRESRDSSGASLSGRSVPQTVGGEAIRPGMRFLHWLDGEIGAPLPESPFATMALCAQGEEARADFQRWLTLKKWYQERGIPWRRGHLYHGPPGTGKTSMARALAQQADMPVFAYDLSTLDNEQFSEAWQNMQEHTPCIALIEDIDGTFQGRQNVLNSERRETLTFDCLLGALGGIQTCDGVFVIITTNKPETLDAALGRPDANGTGTTRPGRIDAAYCLSLPGAAQREHILRRICGECSAEVLHETEGLTAAQVTEHAISAALRTTWAVTP